MKEPTSQEQERLNFILYDMNSVLSLEGWEKVYSAVMAGQFGFAVPEEPPYPFGTSR